MRRWAARRSPSKKFISAGEHLQRAGVYYHFGKFLFVQDLPQMKAAHMQGGRMPPARAAASQSAGRAGRDAVRGQMACRHPAQAGSASRGRRCWPSPAASIPARRRPTPTSSRSSRAASRHWCSTGPARARREYDFAIRGDYEVAAKAVLDFIETRSDLDAGAHRLRRHQPRRLLRAALGRLRQADKSLPRARRPLRLGRVLGRPSRPDPGGVPRPQQERDGRGSAPQGRDADAQGRRRARSPARSTS